MRHFDSLDDIRKAGLEELMELPEMNEQAAREVVSFFRQTDESES